DISMAVGGGNKYNIENCSLHLYYLCQGGHQLIKTIQPKFNEKVVDCHAPISSLESVGNELKLYFRIESISVIALSTLALLQAAIGGVLLTIL
uniref:Uncharacterized protein n=1 Tax=Amphimedon queenslandica TaxID=400682 RepID=A0A1X7TQ73_AMPQE